MLVITTACDSVQRILLIHNNTRSLTAAQSQSTREKCSTKNFTVSCIVTVCDQCGVRGGGVLTSNMSQVKKNNRKMETLYNLSQQFILQYCHHVIWRQVDPPHAKLQHEVILINHHRHSLQCRLPHAKAEEEKDPEKFRANLSSVKEYLTENLVRPVYDGLTERCVQYITHHHLGHGDLLLQLLFQDDLSRSLVISAKHIIYRKWRVREERTLHRYLTTASRLTCIRLPGKTDDRILQMIAANCPRLEELDISHSSNITDTGLLALVGVLVTPDHDYDPLTSDECDEDEEDEGHHGRYCLRSGRKVRAAASKAIKEIRILKRNHQEDAFLKEMSQGSMAYKQLSKDYPYLKEKLGALISKRADESYQHSWRSRGKVYSFSSDGCRALKKLDILDTSYPKKCITRQGDIISDMGVSKEGVLAAVVLLKNLCNVQYKELGDILQLYDYLYSLHDTPAPELKLNYFSETRLTTNKINVATRMCPGINKVDISLFTFSWYEPDGVTPRTHGFMTDIKKLFDLDNLKDFEVYCMDDSQIFLNCLMNRGSNLTRICLTKMTGICFETLSAIKFACQQLVVLDVNVDAVYTLQRHTPLQQVIQETDNTSLTSLKSLKLGGSIPSGKYRLQRRAFLDNGNFSVLKN